MANQKTFKLTLQTNIAALLDAYPQVAPVFFRHYMACVGCSMSGFETVADAARIYNVQPGALLNELYQELSCLRGVQR